MIRVSGVVVAVAALLVAPAVAQAQKGGERLQKELEGKRKGPAAAQGQDVHQEGEYGGVAPGKPSDKRIRRKGRRPLVTWVGFAAKGGGASQFFVQLTRDAEYQQDIVGNKLVVTIAGARFMSRNARRRLDTRFFETSVSKVTMRGVRRRRARKGKPGHPAGIQLTFTFKNPSDAGTASVRSAQEQDGNSYVYLDFGRGTEMPDKAK